MCCCKILSKIFGAKKSERRAEIRRTTTETDILVKLNIDGSGKSKIDTGIGFLDHMLELFAFWGLFDLEIITKRGDLKVDIHHTNEDIGIVLGQTFKKALGEKKGINRIGSASVPMEEVSATVILDISGRGSIFFAFLSGEQAQPKDGYSLKDGEHFLESLASHLGVNMHIKIPVTSNDLHITLEPAFKALGIALDNATRIDSRRKGVSSSKGIID
ncbi:MAG: imidazoleglycerol-phosphate dehydratase [Candidatus Omnitrophota bacterium]